MKIVLETFSEAIRDLREKAGLQLRKVAAYLDIDQSVLSKMEKGHRKASREQVILIAKFFKVDEKELLVKWLAQKLIYETGDDDLALEAMLLAEQQIKYKTKNQPKRK